MLKFGFPGSLGGSGSAIGVITMSTGSAVSRVGWRTTSIPICVRSVGGTVGVFWIDDALGFEGRESNEAVVANMFAARPLIGWIDYGRDQRMQISGVFEDGKLSTKIPMLSAQFKNMNTMVDGELQQ